MVPSVEPPAPVLVEGELEYIVEKILDSRVSRRKLHDTGEEDEDLYDCVDLDEEEGNEIYEVLMKGDEQPAPLKDGYFMKPLQNFLRRDKMSDIFINIEDLRKLHQNFLLDTKNFTSLKTSQNLHQVFLQYKEKFLIYGTYCSHVESASKRLEQISQEHEGFRMKLETN
ncbi:unnamed protein product [Ranitomeya imitator]|uniref:DH domain-containing protein n=1 Tax=Ranitomeya imitator TaxID=111125 RepID=A0ABN9MD21_9NEOB|nr:unnamed protein product [Ranitomeya imitator]